MKTEYGVRAIVELASNVSAGALQSAEIARRQQIPGPFLDQVLMTLRRAGLVRSVRGPRGGHLLNRPATDISLDEVVACLEGKGADSRDGASIEGGSVLAQVTREADQAARRVFASHTLEDLVRRRKRRGPPGQL